MDVALTLVVDAAPRLSNPESCAGRSRPIHEAALFSPVVAEDVAVGVFAISQGAQYAPP